MSTLEYSSSGPVEALAVPQESNGRAARFEAFLTRASEWLNPILVKETRQALKSKQFSVTFTLLLTGAWVWSFMGLAIIGPGAEYSFEGANLFFGYFWVLSIALLVIVPYGAFRSLAAEREERTFELLCITTLKPRQIVTGKLASAIVQMVVYLSAISPCLVFTYMLRGLDVLTILFVLAYLVMASLGFSLLGLLVATLSQEKHWQILLSVVYVVGLVVACFFSWMIGGVVIQFFPEGYFDPDFWIAQGAMASFYIAYFVLVYLAVAAQLTFQGDNRSTALRAAMLGPYVLFAGWLGFAYLHEGRDDPEPKLLFLFFSLIHWWVLGMFMTGESPELSPRVKRDLPRSFLGRLLFTWFNPGPATGYAFVVANMLGLVVLLFVAVHFSVSSGRRPGPVELQTAAIVALCYVTIYLGASRLLLGFLRRYAQVSLLLSMMVNILLVMALSLIPLIIHWSSPTLRRESYLLMHVGNPTWTLDAVIESYGDSGAIVMVLGSLALFVFALNLPAIIREAQHVRIAKPQRVSEEDAVLAALHAPAPVPQSPWD